MLMDTRGRRRNDEAHDAGNVEDAKRHGYQDAQRRQEETEEERVLMYFIIKSRNDSMPADPKIRKAASDAYDQAQSLPLKEAAKERRKILKRRRFEELAERPDLYRKSTEEMRAIRRNMERRINDL